MIADFSQASTEEFHERASKLGVCRGQSLDSSSRQGHEPRGGECRRIGTPSRLVENGDFAENVAHYRMGKRKFPSLCSENGQPNSAFDDKEEVASGIAPTEDQLAGGQP